MPRTNKDRPYCRRLCRTSPCHQNVRTLFHIPSQLFDDDFDVLLHPPFHLRFEHLIALALDKFLKVLFTSHLPNLLNNHAFVARVACEMLHLTSNHTFQAISEHIHQLIALHKCANLSLNHHLGHLVEGSEAGFVQFVVENALHRSLERLICSWLCVQVGARRHSLDLLSIMCARGGIVIVEWIFLTHLFVGHHGA
ncbi:unnamed protein product [Periconia digitata]|uniref:Uncharacterized protein n=1 Tax=Periconia digitata TaxID=1303443 RepID=A0A9W4XH13_9PLEO|nr:unnamed protein product [Periconia digitata]